MFADAHVHLLPRIDNGPCRLWEAEDMLRAMYAAKVRAAVLTPHFNADDEGIAEFTVRRKLAFTSLLQAVPDLRRNFRFFLSAETELVPGVSSLRDLSELCIPKTRYLPVTLPIGTYIPPEIMREIATLIQKRKIYPLICHLERYITFYKEKELQKLLSLPCAIFCISPAGLDCDDTARLIFRNLQAGKRFLIGSNGHNTRSRPPVLTPDWIPHGICARVLSILTEETQKTLRNPAELLRPPAEPTYSVFGADT